MGIKKYLPLGQIILIEYSVVAISEIIGLLGYGDGQAAVEPTWSLRLVVHLLCLIICLVALMSIFLLSISALQDGNFKSEFGIGQINDLTILALIKILINFYILILYYLLSVLSIILVFASFYQIFGLCSGEQISVTHGVGQSSITRGVVQSNITQGVGSAIYFSVVTWFTVGYGDLTPVPGPARVVAVCEIFCGVVFTALTTAGAVNLLGVFGPPNTLGTEEESK